ncbi:(2Fe-2S)-binding protein [Thalassospira xiamenensis]|uniref:(2Fe-2S)-binding protein n=1 Tax=Thalassospira xiamenensis TaxID=220697 RepID=UPI000DEDF003|nr:(2Fe-2S)-binding protein [Thalassospira xiamenensis]RCK33572.1 hypothetical protein TH24_21220 [Thalassospira xiamenensis]
MKNVPLSTGDEIVCYCKSKTRADIEAFMHESGASFDKLIKTTGVGTECAACRLNLEVLVGDHFASQSFSPAIVKKTSFMVPADQYNCGYYLQDADFSTTLRISNPYLPVTKTQVQLSDYSVVIDVYHADGKPHTRKKLDLKAADDLSVSFSEFPRLPRFGWFTVNILPVSPGFVGNSRPQVAIQHGDHCSTYHMQLVKDASKRRTITVPVIGGETNMFFPMVNMTRENARLTVTLEGIKYPFEASHVSEIPGNGAVFYSIDDSFSKLPEKNIIIATVESNVPLRRYFFVVHQDGSLSMDHFPNSR